MKDAAQIFAERMARREFGSASEAGQYTCDRCHRAYLIRTEGGDGLCPRCASPAKQPLTPTSVASHTPGPWRIGEIRVMSDRAQNDPSDMHWPIFWPDCGCAAHVFRHEDARLIAAAPDLLAACIAGLDFCAKRGGRWAEFEETLRTAITKAIQNHV